MTFCIHRSRIWPCMHNMKRGSQNQMDAIHHRVAPPVCQWFISLACKERFTAAIWKASGDLGYQGYLDFLLGKNVGAATPCNNSPVGKHQDGFHPQPERCGNGHEAKLIVSGLMYSVCVSVCVCLCVCVCMCVCMCV